MRIVSVNVSPSDPEWTERLERLSRLREGWHFGFWTKLYRSMATKIYRIVRRRRSLPPLTRTDLAGTGDFHRDRLPTDEDMKFAALSE